jgi:glyoxylase-like metal-dependent hydrolase (beta-lactamase superfamily II)
MAKVKVMISGYAKEIDNGWIASSTVALIKLNDLNIIVDPGCARKKLLEALSNENLKTADINYILLTHRHTDHMLLAGIFENAKILTNSEVFDNDIQIQASTIKELEKIEIIKTPGHSGDSKTFIVKVENGIYAIVGDLWWWRESEEQKTDKENLLSHFDEYTKDKELITKSRTKILEIADYIIPGHGEMFKVNKLTSKLVSV